METASETRTTVLLIEPFYGGSHKQLVDLLEAEVIGCVKYTLPAKKWHWRARTSALYFSQIISRNSDYRVLFASSVLNLAELVALRRDLAPLKKIMYFHENQLVYPVRKQQDRDFQYGYNQILSCLVADVILFNSKYNQDSFIDSIKTFLKLMPDFRPKNLEDQIKAKSRVLYFPILYPCIETIKKNHDSFCCASKQMKMDELLYEESETIDKIITKPSNFKADLGEEQTVSSDKNGTEILENTKCISETTTHASITYNHLSDLENNGGLDNPSKCDKYQSKTVEPPIHIVWPHRWEHDKNPELFFKTLFELKQQGLDFRLSVLGETYADIPEVFDEAKQKLSDHIKHWGFVSLKEEYYGILFEADIVVSTADHEFFGVAMLEAVHCGCFPIAPNKLVYPEIFTERHLYNTPTQLQKLLKNYCKRPSIVRQYQNTINLKKYSWGSLKTEYLEELDVNGQDNTQ